MKRWLSVGVLFVLVANLLTACGQTQQEEYVSPSQLFAQVNAQYTENSFCDYTNDIIEITRSERFTLTAEVDLTTLEETITDIVCLYEDADLQYPVNSIEQYDEKTKTITFHPPRYPDGNISASDLTTEQIVLHEYTKGMLFGKDSEDDWGNLGKFYLAQYYDFETGEKLEKPLVTIVYVEGELKAPQVNFTPSSNGLAGFSWNEIEGATAYVVFKIQYTQEKGFHDAFGAPAHVIGYTTQTSWQAQAPNFGDNETCNEDFRSFKYSQEDWLSDSIYGDQDYPEGEVVPKTESARYGVMAIHETGSSMFSNLFTQEELAAQLPYQQAFYTEKENGFSNQCTDIGLAPSHAWILMCDGTVARKPIIYDTSKANVRTARYIYVDSETGEYTGGENIPELEIPYSIEGAPFLQTVRVEEYYETEKMDADIEMLSKRQETLYQQSGARTLTNAYSRDYKTPEHITQEQVRLPNQEIEVTATNAMSAYLATCLLSQNEKIDLSDFSGSTDNKMVEDAFLEAYYQNPLILGLQSYSIDRRGNVTVLYDDSARVTQKKQTELRARVAGIVKEIIRPQMTEIEKEIAINQYLCDNVTYDEQALENAETYDYQKTDSKFKDSFTAYGALIDGRCVCAGYAAAFKLLCEEAGLDCIVVTGTLEGQLAHAWNKVNIEKEWQIVDVTNNDNEEIFNALLNLPQNVSRGTLVEDKDYLVDRAIGNYTATQIKQEYYRVTDRFFPVNEIAIQLANDLNDTGITTLRTDYDLTDESFQAIAQEVYDQMDEDTQLSGYFWMGVIYLKKV